MPQKSKGRSSSTERIHPFHPGRPYPFHTAKDDPFHLAWAPPRFGLGKIIEITGNEESLGEGHYVTIIMEDGSNVVGQVMSDVKVGDLVSGLKNELFRYAPVLPPGTVFAASDDLQPFGVHVASPSAGRAMMGGVEYYLDESGRLREAKEGKQSESSSSAIGRVIDIGSESSDIGIMNPILVNIAEAVRTYDLQRSPVWQEIIAAHKAARLFAIESRPESFELSEHNQFEGRAVIAVQIPSELRSRHKVIGSMTIPARVFGHLAGGRISVEKFDISGQH